MKSEEATPGYRKDMSANQVVQLQEDKISWQPDGHNMWGLRVRETVLSWEGVRDARSAVDCKLP